MIRLSNVTKVYRSGPKQVMALRGVDLDVTEPGFYGIMGPSGSGKSTLLHLIGGLDRPDEGEIIVDDAPVHAMSEAELTAYRRQRIGIVFQQFNLIPTMTARDNVSLPGLLDGRPTDWLNQRADELLGLLGLSDRVDHRPEALSGGEQQRVAIARALLFEPKVLLADEPTGNLDSATSEQIWSMLADLAESRQLTILMVTHEPAAAAHCKHVVVLRDGTIQNEIDVEDHDARWLANRYQQSGD